MDDEGREKGAVRCGTMDRRATRNGWSERQDRTGVVKQEHGAVRHQDMGSTLSYFFLVQLVFANMQDGIGLDPRGSKRV